MNVSSATTPDKATLTTGADSDAWAVIGGGILGMTLALRLAEAGKQVTIYEAAKHLGGLADAWSVGHYVWDRHYHVTLLSDSHLRTLLRELELDESMQWVETKTGFFTDNQLHSVSNSLEFLRFPPLRLHDKLRLAWTIWFGSKLKNWRRLEQIPVTTWLRKHSGQRTFEKIWLPLLRAKLGDNYQSTSAAFIWATIQRLYAARRTGLKKEMFGYLPGGYARFLQQFQLRLAELGVELRCGADIESITTSEIDGSDTASPLPATHLPRKQIKFAHGEAAWADHVVLTVPSPVVAQVLPQLKQDERQRHEHIEYQGLVCASVLLRKPLSEFYVVNITDDGIPFTGVIEMTALVDRQCFGGHALVYLPKYVPAHDPILTTPDDVIQCDFLDGLCRMYPDLDPHRDVIAFKISRVRHVMALSTLGYSTKLPAQQTYVPGVSVVNSAQIVNGTLNVNETIRLAETAARNLLGTRTAR
ncbi:MAG: NAD(P)/FAD-dependent oxidoreductase [Planctomycetales bacterium]|nr:NAD(P)/FAD-dependent oxidoreductase [Planctomycetales bacterium]